MGRLCLLLALVCLLAGVPSVASLNPGFQIQVSSRGLSYANSVAVSALSQTLRTMRIPRQTGGDGGFTYDVWNLRITNFNRPSSRISLLPGRGLHWSISNAAISAEADFKAGKKIWFFWVRASGSVSASASEVSLAVDLHMGKDSGGRPTIQVASCSAGLGRLDVTIRNAGFFTWLYNLLLGIFRGTIKNMLQDQMCKMTTKFVNEDAARKLSDLKVQADIMGKFLLDYRLLTPPVFTSWYLQTQHKGLVYWKANQQEPPFSCPALPPSQSASSMANLWVSECLANSMGYAAHVNNFTRFTVNDMPSDVRRFLRTSCGSEACLGSLFPQIAQQYPNRQAEISLYTTSAPQLTISGGVATVQVAGRAELALSSSSLFALSLNLALRLSASIRNDRVVVRIEHIQPQFAVTVSSVGTVPTDKVQRVLQAVISNGLVPHLNSVGAQGLPLPVTGVVALVSPRLQLLERALLISTDLSYRG